MFAHFSGTSNSRERLIGDVAGTKWFFLCQEPGLKPYFKYVQLVLPERPSPPIRKQDTAEGACRKSPNPKGLET